jgi:hypothetical protein
LRAPAAQLHAEGVSNRTAEVAGLLAEILAPMRR